MSKFKAGQVWVTRDGRKARIVATDSKIRGYPVIALIEDESRGEEVASFSAFGVFDPRGTSSRDLVREHREPREWWVNVYDNGFRGALHSTKESAEDCERAGVIDRIRVREVIE